MNVEWNGQIHPAAEMFPMILEDEFVLMVEDIKRNGLSSPGWLLPDGTLLDGRNRLKACQRAGIEMRWQVYDGDNPVGFVVSHNMRRRQLTEGQRAIVALKMEKLYAEQARLRMGSKSVANPNTVSGEADLPHLNQASVSDSDVKAVAKANKPMKRRAPQARDLAAADLKVSGRAVQQAKRVERDAPDLLEKVEAGQLSLDAADKEVRGRVAKQRYLAKKAEWDEGANSHGSRWEMRAGDFRKSLAELPDGSVDAIVTDPPYPDEFLPLWADLAKEAARLLRPGAPLIAYSGQFRLLEVLNHLCGPLTYQWTLSLDMPGQNNRFRGPNMIQGWKPVIICTNGKWGPHDWFVDRVTSPAKEQQLYEWQQNAAPAAEIIRRYVPKDGLVVDPFTGVGSFGVAALSVGRRFIGVEIDDERYMTACVRMKESE